MIESDLIEDLRAALRSFASGVVIIAARGPAGERHAMAATSATPLSFAPPAMLVCVNQNASIHSALKAGADFSVNILSRAQHPLARLCGGEVKGEARFAAPGWREDCGGLPYLADAVASIACAADGALAYGSHEIFIGRVRSVLRSSAEPLVYCDGRYGGVSFP